jgi:hypothetical protein
MVRVHGMPRTYSPAGLMLSSQKKVEVKQPVVVSYLRKPTYFQMFFTLLF